MAVAFHKGLAGHALVTLVLDFLPTLSYRNIGTGSRDQTGFPGGRGGTVRMHRFVCCAFLLLVLVTCNPLAQPPPPQSLTTERQSAIPILHGDYLFVCRTPAHIKYSSRTVFEQVKNTITEFLASQHVEIVMVEESDFAALTEENLEISEIADLPDVFQKAKLVGASHILLLTVDRPMKSWVKLTIQCFDLSGQKLWEEKAANTSALTGSSGLHSALERMEARLAARIGQPGLMMGGSMIASTVQSGLATAPGASPAAWALPVENKAAAGEVVANQPSVELPITPASETTTVALQEDTTVRLVLIRPVNSQTAKVGDKLEFQVLEDVKVGGLVVIPRKSSASGVVTELQAPRRKGKAGRISIKAETVFLINHETASLRGLRTLQSGNRNVSIERQSEITNLIQGTAGFGVFFLPLYTLGHGEYPVLSVGMEFTAALSQPVTMQRAALLTMQPIEEKRHGNAVVTVYHISNPRGDRPKFYCGNAGVARLQSGTQFPLTLRPGKYWFRCNSKKNAVCLTLEEGGEYYLRVDSMMISGNRQNPGFSQLLHLRDHDIGELEASEQAPLDPKNIKNISKIDSALLTAAPN